MKINLESKSTTVTNNYKKITLSVRKTTKSFIKTHQHVLISTSISRGCSNSSTLCIRQEVRESSITSHKPKHQCSITIVASFLVTRSLDFATCYRTSGQILPYIFPAVDPRSLIFQVPCCNMIHSPLTIRIRQAYLLLA